MTQNESEWMEKINIVLENEIQTVQTNNGIVDHVDDENGEHISSSM